MWQCFKVDEWAMPRSWSTGKLKHYRGVFNSDNLGCREKDGPLTNIKRCETFMQKLINIGLILLYNENSWAMKYSKD